MQRIEAVASLTFPIFSDYDSQIIFSYPSVCIVYLPQRILFPWRYVDGVRNGWGFVPSLDN